MDKKKSENICYSKHFATQLNKLLRANKIKKRQLAKAIGVSEDAIYKWTSTDQRPEWIEYMCKMFVFLAKKTPDFSPIKLFTEKAAQLNIDGFFINCIGVLSLPLYRLYLILLALVLT